MDIKIKTEMTPNPNALKFITNAVVIASDRVSFSEPEQCAAIPLASTLLAMDNVTQVHFFENVVTITQDGSTDWGQLEETVKQYIVEKMPTHDPNFSHGTDKPDDSEMTPDLRRIDEILNSTIRPALQSDGGDLEVLGLEENRLMVRYQGACGGCPSAAMGTLQAIEGILREQFHPEIEVHAL
jgi:Fe-S cluster biogenesis protein NfuA